MTVPALIYTVRADDQSRAVFAANRQEIQKTQAATQRLNADMTGVGRTIGSLKAFGAGLGIGILSAELIQLPGIVRDLVAEASTLAKTADLIGLSTDELQRLQFGFQLAGVEVATTEDALQKFGKRLSEADSKGGRLADILQANGIALRDNEGRLRPVMDLLRDYAGLIKGAGNEQDRLSLANEAFGRSGAALVLALRGGADGVRDLMREVDRAGGVLDEELLRRAEILDDDLARLWRRFEINSKSAILHVGEWLADLSTDFEGALSGLGNASVWKDLTAFLDDYGLIDHKGVFELQVKLGGGLAALSKQQQDQIFYRDDLKIPGSSSATEITVHPTILPRKKTGGGESGKPSDYERIIAQLTTEYTLIGMTASEQKKFNLIRAAGVSETSKQGKAIAELVDQIDQQGEAQARVNDITSLFGGIASSEIGRFVSELGLADTAAGRLVATLAEAALKAALLGEGPLSSFLGTSNGGLIGLGISAITGSFGGGDPIAAAFKGMYAEGGTLGAGEWGIAGENGPEPVVGPAKVISSKDAFGQSGHTTVIHFNVTTPDADSFKRSDTQLKAMLVDAVNRGKRGR
ncbi:hypothetical protein [Roseibium litorale]|uniref:Uncharacterized protein n=1 Tax=Roseibium litorale TaxID=2803841 RepID=A0ABR9CUJ7_9HYPH|nr:hypothetical protein [Roseibium litorale]MBD8894040.1 hypothetical protein [Roseibium litorale]